MKIPKTLLFVLTNALLMLTHSSCTTPGGDKLIENDQSRFSQQVRGLPDRESSEQENAYKAAQRKADMTKK